LRDFTWAGKAVGGFIVLFGVSIVVVPMSVFTGYFLMNLQGDFYQNQVRFLKAEAKDLWQLKMRPGPDAPAWRKKLFELLYEHLIQLNEGLAKTMRLHDSMSQKSLSRSFQLFKWTSISASLVFACLTILENAEYMNTDHCKDIAEGSGRAFFKGSEENCVKFVHQVDTAEYYTDLLFLHFFILEFILRVVALGWRHFCSELGVAEMLSITGLLMSLTQLRDDALHHPERLRYGNRNRKLLLGSVTFLRLTRLISIGSYFGLLRALRKVNWIARWSLCKSFYFLVAVWFTHAMLLHMAEATNHTAALAGAQILPAAPPNTLWMSEIPERPHTHQSLLQHVVNIQNASLVPNMSNVSNVSDVSDVSDFATLSKGFSNTTYVLVNVSNLSNPKTVLLIPKMLTQSHRFGDYLSAMQYSLQHLTGDYPIVEYSIPGKLVLLMGLIIGTCAVAAWTAIFSSSMVNYLANEAEDQLARAAERRMLLAIEVVLRLQRQWRRRKRAREAARARGELPEPVAQHPTSESNEGLFLRYRNKARRLVLRHTATGERLMQFFQWVLVFNIALSMIHSLPEIKNHHVAEKGQVFEEMVCTVIFCLEFALMLVAGKGRQGSHWYLFRFVDFICIFPGIMEIYQMRTEWQRLHELGEKIEKSDEDAWIQDWKIAIDAFQMIRVFRILFWHQWRHEVQVVVDGIVSAGPIMVLPTFLSLFIWVMSSAMFVWMENVYDGPSKDFFTSLPTGMYWTSSFLIGEWVLADFSPGGGNRVCIAIVLFGIMAFGIATGILMEAVQQAIAVAMLELREVRKLLTRHRVKGGAANHWLCPLEDQLSSGAPQKWQP